MHKTTRTLGGVGSGLTLLALGVLPTGCTGDEFSSCEGRGCTAEAAGGGAGADGEVTTGTSSGGANDSTTESTTASGDSGGSAGAGGSGGSSGASSGGTGGSLGSGAASAGESSSNGTDGGQAGESGASEGAGGTDPAVSCEDTCEGTCCDDVCVDVESNIEHCGACGVTCDLDQAEESCVAGSCVVTQCRDGALDCNGDPSDGCEQADVGVAEAPAPTRPMLGAFTGSLHARDVTGSLRPEFTWAEVQAVSCEAVTYHVQVDDECALDAFEDCDFPSPELDVTGITTGSFEPEADLPVEEAVAPLGRRYYWRVRACEGTVMCSEWSKVFYMDVGRAREDVTGDGYPDVVGATENGEFFIARGSADFYEEAEFEMLPTTQTPLHPDAPQFSFLGDVNGDGFNDVGGAGIAPSGDAQTLYVWLGAEAFGALPGTLVGSGVPNKGFPPGVWSAGDSNGDGYADLVLMRPGDDSIVSAFSYKFGARTLTNSREDELVVPTTPPPPDVEGLFLRSAASGDFNGDGYPDQAVDHSALQEGVRLLIGGSSPALPLTRDVNLFPSDEVCQPTMGTLDFDGDDVDDLAVMCRNTRRFAVVFGDRDPGAREIWSTERKTQYADFAVGDIDGSGFDDLIVSDGTTFWGAADPSTDPEDSLMTEKTYEPIVLADHDADGYLDALRAFHWYGGVFTAETWDQELYTTEGEELVVVALAR